MNGSLRWWTKDRPRDIMEVMNAEKVERPQGPTDFQDWPRHPVSNPQDLRQLLHQVPQTPGVYAFFDTAGVVLYVGKALALRRRLASYAALERGPRKGDVRPATLLLFRFTTHVAWRALESEAEALITEAALIRRHQPRLNVRLRDDHGQMYVGFSVDACPRVFTVRAPAGREPASEAHPGAKYVGPFSDGRALRRTLDALRRSLPFAVHPGSPSRCLEHEIGLCPIKPGMPEEASATLARRNVRALSAVLRGETKALGARWRREMRAASRDRDYERAARRRDDLEALARVAKV